MGAGECGRWDVKTDTRSDARFLADEVLDWLALMTVLTVVGVGVGVWLTTTHCATARDRWRLRKSE